MVQERISRLEQALLDTEHKTQVLQQFAKAGIWEFDLVKNKLWWSSELYKIFGQDPLTFQPSFESFLSCIPAEELEAVKRAYLFSLDSRTTYNISHRIILPDGSIRYVEEHCETRFNAEGKALYSIGTCQDITEKQGALLLIEESANRFKEMVAKAPMAYVNFNQDCLITLVNEQFCELVGERSDNLIGRDLRQFFPPDQQEEFRAKLLKSKQENGVTADFSLQRFNGDVISIAMTIKRHAIGKHHPSEYHGILLDITQMTNYQSRIKEKNKRLINIAWSQSHILRHPVTNLLGLMPLIDEELHPASELASIINRVNDDLKAIDTTIHRIVSKCSSVNVNNH